MIYTYNHKLKKDYKHHKSNSKRTERNQPSTSLDEKKNYLRRKKKTMTHFSTSKEIPNSSITYTT